jgi:hypothetical protein
LRLDPLETGLRVPGHKAHAGAGIGNYFLST